MYAEFYRLGQAHGIAAVVLNEKLTKEGWTPQQIVGVMNLLDTHRTLMAQAYVSLLVPPGVYAVHIDQEYLPWEEQMRQAAD